MSERPSLSARLARVQAERPLRFLFVAVLLSVVSLLFIRDLGLDSRFLALLPEDRPSVGDLEQARVRMQGLSTLQVGVQSPSGDVEAMRRFTVDLAERLADLPEGPVGTVDWNVRDHREFVEANYHQFVDTELLVRLFDAMDMRLQSEMAQHNPLLINLEADSEAEPLDDVIDDLEAQREAGRSRSERYPDGYFQHPDGDLIALFVRSNAGALAGGAGDVTRVVGGVVDDLDPSSYGEDLYVTLGGDVIVAKEEQKNIAQELVLATALTVTLVMGVILVFFRRFRALPLLGIGLIPPVLASFAIAQMTVGSLNTSTAFLGSVIIGNGVNPNVLWLSRYFEERKLGLDVRSAIEATHRNVWLATLAASGAAALAYASLSITEFRGFRDFGIIGGSGMVLCWLSALLILPAAAALSERIRPLVFAEGSVARHGGAFTGAFARLSERFPRSVLVFSALLSLVSAGAVYDAVISDPIEYDFRKLRSIREATNSEARLLNRRVHDIVPKSSTGGGIAILLPSIEDVPTIVEQLEPTVDVDHGRIRTIYDLLPREAEVRRELLEDIREVGLQLRRHADEETVARIDEYMPPEEIPVLTVADIPERVARPFTELDGTRGTVVYVEKVDGVSAWDGRYMMRWAGTLRELRLEDGARPPLAGRATIFADIVQAVYSDMPIAIVAALSATVVLCLIAFVRWRDRLLTIASLLLGIVWMAGSMALLGMRLNFLNFLAFPITFGNGVDYSINIMQRFRLEEGDDAEADPIGIAVRRTGGAVMLCSLTTIIGYTSLYVSANQAMRSFGTAMAISEVTCLVAALVTLPAVLHLLRRRASATPRL